MQMHQSPEPRQRWRWLTNTELKNECKFMRLMHSPLKQRKIRVKIVTFGLDLSQLG
ncbi:hypothetical protein [Enterobacter kobei]|uniref:hypothetical protein n=1 Tax=Enterobacter kobei TaxID=208224 RepID=UPI001910A1B9|nr:hypothetical protein [Enterobacter kobei]